MTVFDDCSAAHVGELELTLKCVSNWIESETSRLQLATEQNAQASGSGGVSDEDFTNWMLLLTGSMVFFMQAGESVCCNRQQLI